MNDHSIETGNHSPVMHIPWMGFMKGRWTASHASAYSFLIDHLNLSVSPNGLAACSVDGDLARQRCGRQSSFVTCEMPLLSAPCSCSVKMHFPEVFLSCKVDSKLKKKSDHSENSYRYFSLMCMTVSENLLHEILLEFRAGVALCVSAQPIRIP